MFDSGEPVTLTRECWAVTVPEGSAVELPSGTMGMITQALGGSFTLYVEGNLYRVAGDDADALGKEVARRAELAQDASDADVERLVREQLHTCYDPEIPIDIVELGLIYDCRVIGLTGGSRRVEVAMTLTAPGCGMGEILVAEVREKLARIPSVATVEVELVFDPPWSPDRMSEAARLEVGLL
jgi:probable FeS assembly SUF system protein SufT